MLALASVPIPEISYIFHYLIFPKSSQHFQIQPDKAESLHNGQLPVVTLAFLLSAKSLALWSFTQWGCVTMICQEDYLV